MSIRRIFGFVLMSLIATVISLAIIKRVPFLARLTG